MKKELTDLFKNTEISEAQNFNSIKISVKSSDVFLSIEAYRQLSKATDYPLHLGITEAGGFIPGSIKSSIGLENILASCNLEKSLIGLALRFSDFSLSKSLSSST